MFNEINFTNSYIVPAAATAVVFGLNVGQVTPAQLVVSNATGALTITLPQIQSVPTSPPSAGQTVVGVGGGFRMTIFNASGAAITITPAAGDATLPTAVIASAANAITTLQAVPTTGTWYKVA